MDLDLNEDLDLNTDTVVNWLVYYPDYQALVCCKHGYAIQNLATHLNEEHKELEQPKRRKLIDWYANNNVVLRPAKQVEKPSSYSHPLKGLTLWDGFECLTCSQLSTSKKWMQNHNRNRHGWFWSKAYPEPYSKVKLQTFFKGNLRKYWKVLTQEEENELGEGEGEGEGEEASYSNHDGNSNSNSDNGRNYDAVYSPKVLSKKALMEEIKEQWTYDRQTQEALQKVLAEGILKHETTNWLKRTGWPDHFQDKDLDGIYASSKMPCPEDSELQRLVDIVDNLFFDRCMKSIKALPLITRLWLASPHLADAHSRPFGPLQEKTSMHRYFTYWKRFLCYCMRVMQLSCSESLKQHNLRFTEPQTAMMQSLWKHLQDEACTEQQLQEEVLQLSAAFWMQHLDACPFASPLWHFIGVLGIDGDDIQFKPAHLFTYILAGFVYVGRVLLVESAIPLQKRSGLRNLGKTFEEVRSLWLCKATYSPMGYILSLLLYGKKIARETGSRLMISWAREDELMYFMGKALPLNSLRILVAEMTEEAEELLWSQLMFKEGSDNRFTIPLSKVEDDMTYTQRGKSFIHSNGLEGKEQEMLEDLISGRRKTTFIDSTGQWKWKQIRRYNQAVDRWLELILLLCHITGGQPIRAEEMLGLRLANGISRDRNVFIVDGQVMLVSHYHKSMAHFDSPKVIPRFLPERIGQLLVMYMVYIRPLTDRWEAQRWAMAGKPAPPSDFIWHDENGPWEGSRMSRAMAAKTSKHIGVRITLRDYRHIAVAISRKHAREKGRQKSDFDQDEDEDEANKGEQYEVADDLAASHTGQTAEHYGVTIDILKRLTADSLETFRQVSDRWHQFLGLTKEKEEREKVEKVEKEREKKEQKRRYTAVSQLVVKRPKILPLQTVPDEQGIDRVVMKALQQVTRDEQAQFRTPKQEEAVRAAAAKESPLVVILPTSGGKSFVFMVPAALPGAGVTVVVAPYVELKKQLVSRCLDAGLDCIHWPQARQFCPRVVLVSAEAASSDDFLQWASDLQTRGVLDRVVIDECHLVFTAADEYRPKLRGLVLLRQLGCPMVFLTATLPPLQQREFEEAMLLQSPRYIRDSTHRVNIEYSVQRVQNGRGIIEVKKLVEVMLKTWVCGEKGVIYCRSYAKCQAMAYQLKCHYYYGGDSNDPEAVSQAQRAVGFQAWIDGETPFIVATAVLGSGINVPGIKVIIHLDPPYSLIDYSQEGGRGGRDGEQVKAIMVVEEKD
jgi:hypothetical protein